MTKKKIKIIKEIIKEQNSKVLFLEEKFDQALIGTSRMYGDKIVAAYDSSKIIKILTKEHEDELVAFEHFKNNLEVEYTQDKPVFINDFRKIKEPKFKDLKPDTTMDL